MMFLLKYWRYFALLGAVLALFAWHKWECSKSFDQGYAKHEQETRDATERLRKRIQAKVDSLEVELAKAQESRQIEVRTVDREVIKTVMPDCPDAFDTYLRLRNAYARAATGKSADLGVRPMQAPSGERGDRLE